MKGILKVKERVAHFMAGTVSQCLRQAHEKCSLHIQIFTLASAHL
jgi:hypothetical protein